MEEIKCKNCNWKGLERYLETLIYNDKTWDMQLDVICPVCSFKLG